MKVIILLLISTASYCQVKSLFPTEVVKPIVNGFNIHQTTYGIPDLFPKVIAEKTTIGYDVYNTTYGIKDLFPSKSIEFKNNQIEIYDYNSIFLKPVNPIKELDMFNLNKDE